MYNYFLLLEYKKQLIINPRRIFQMMTERQMKCFLTLAQTGSFVETAHELFMTQPAVSQQIAALEKNLDVTLFIRSKNGVKLTPAGESFYLDASNLMLYNSTILERARYRNASCTAVRDISYTMPLRLMPEIIRKFRDAYPSILPRLSRAHDSNQSRRTYLKRNDISLAQGSLEDTPKDFLFTELYHGGFVCLLPKDYPLSENEHLNIPDLHVDTIFACRPVMENPLLMQLNSYMSSWHGNAILTLVNNCYEAECMVSGGCGIAVLPDFYAPLTGHCIMRPLDYDKQYHIGLFCSEKAPDDVLDFCRIAQEICAADDRAPVLI
jgi:DNA-binding transcriptional LysR family regulator